MGDAKQAVLAGYLHGFARWAESEAGVFIWGLGDDGKEIASYPLAYREMRYARDCIVSIWLHGNTANERAIRFADALSDKDTLLSQLADIGKVVLTPDCFVPGETGKAAILAALR